jgi:hypothetical protein
MEKNSNEFNIKLNDYINTIPNSKYIFEVTKLCGYGEFVLVFKDDSVLDVYKTISKQFNAPDIKSLFLTDGVKRFKLPLTETFSIRNFITRCQNDETQSKYLTPIYPLPSPVVYRIYIDDGHCHGNDPCN